jgi:hypothetical protein
MRLTGLAIHRSTDLFDGGSMTRLLPPLHEGHAPIFLHQAFDDALDAYRQWGLDMDEPAVVLDEKNVPISAVFGRMRSCTDLMPARILDEVRATAGDKAAGLPGETPTYAEAAFLMRALCVARLRQE